MNRVYKDESLSPCKVYDGEVMEIEEENHSEDQRMSSSSPDLFSSVREVNGGCYVSLISPRPLRKLFPLMRRRRQHAVRSPRTGGHDRTTGR